MKKVLIFFGAILFIVVFGYYCIFLVTPKTLMAQEDQTGFIEVEDLAIIKGIEVGAPIENYSGLNPTEKIDLKRDLRRAVYYYYYYYPDFTIISGMGGEGGDPIIGIIITGRNIKTRRGIGIGSSEKEVYKHYGDTEKEEDLITYYCPNDIDYRGISFKIIKGKVVGIAAFSGSNPFDFE